MQQTQIDLIDELIEHFQTHSSYPQLTPNQATLLDNECRQNLLVRGFPDPLNPETPVGRLTQMQKAAIELVCNYHDPRTLNGKLKTLNLTTPLYNQWLKNPYFFKALQREMNRRFATNLQIDAQSALGHLIANEKDLQAVKYFHEVTGIYRPQTETQVNLTVILGKLMEVLVRFVEPSRLPELANEIETKVLGVVPEGKVQELEAVVEEG